MGGKEFNIKEKEGKSFYFVGVTTKKSSIMNIFPLWMEVLGHSNVKIYPYDLRIHDESGNYRRAVARIKYDSGCYGALVTTHKMDLYSAAKGMFEYLDPYAKLLHEISCISKNKGDKLEGHAKDPLSSGAAHDYFIKKKYYGENGAHVLIFGAGGSSIATILHLVNKKNKDDRPSKIVVVNRSKEKLNHLKKIINRLKTDIEIEYICNTSPEVNDSIMAKLPAYSVVVNATGMGKDTPGSPITDKGLFPENGWAWEFNYRGELDFMHQAEAQIKTRGVKIEDGWLYFIHGWTQVIFQAFHIQMTEGIFNKLKEIAGTLR